MRKAGICMLILIMSTLLCGSCAWAVTEENELTGTWEYLDEENGMGAVYVLNGDGTGTYTMTVGEEEVTYELKYEISDGHLLVTYVNNDIFTEDDVFDNEFRFEDPETLIIKDSFDEEMTFVRADGDADLQTEAEAEETEAEDPFYITPITDELFDRIYGKSFKEDCTVPREDLRYLHVLHVDLDGAVHEGEMIVNYHIAEDVLDILRQLYEAEYPIEKIRLVDEYDADDELSMEDNNSSSFNFRFISHTTRVSKHGLGLAVDINTLYNPYTKVVEGERIIEPITGEPYLDRDADFPYKIDHEDLCYRLFTEHGFEWGGDWEDRKDYQHFEIPTDLIAEWYPENQ